MILSGFFLQQVGASSKERHDRKEKMSRLTEPLLLYKSLENLVAIVCANLLGHELGFLN